MDWQEEPATQQQLLRLQEYGFVPTFPLTVTQAARLIRQYSKHPGRQPTPPVAEAPAEVSSPAPAQRSVVQQSRPLPSAPRPSLLSHAPIGTGRVSENARIHAYSFRLAVEQAQANFAENPERPGGRADVHSAIAARQRFWLDTCRNDQDLHAVSSQALEFRQTFGARFFPPSWGEIEEVLDALDLAMPGWDDDHPELFYETLKLNFPSLLRHE